VWLQQWALIVVDSLFSHYFNTFDVILINRNLHWMLLSDTLSYITYSSHYKLMINVKNKPYLQR
jgi:hypothetical protein